MKKAIYLTCVLAVTILVKCKKDDGGTSQTDYAPSTIGSSFTYTTYDTTSASTKTVTYTIAKDTPAYGKTYVVFSGTDTSEIYRAKSGSNYYQLFNLPALQIFAFEQLYLKDDAAVGTTWPQSVNFPNPLDPTTTLSATFTYNIVEKGASMTVGANNYTDVIHVRMNLRVTGNYTVNTPPLPPFTIPLDLDMGGGDFYYAKGVGMIRTNMSIQNSSSGLPIPPGSLPTVRYTQTLTSYNIK